MKRTKVLAGLLVSGACLGMIPGNAIAGEEKPTADLTVSSLSQYVWRGFALSKDSVVIQPSMTVGYKGLAANVWANLDTDPYSATTDEPNNWTETDFTLSYDWTMGPVGFSAGYIYYGLDSAEDTQEFYLSAALDSLLSPTITLYRDTDNLAGWYVTLGVAHSFSVTGKLTLDLGAQVGYLDADEASSYGEVNGGIESSTDAYSGLHDGLLSASMTIPVNEYLSVTPELYYSFPLTSDASDLIEVRNQGLINDADDSYIYGGVSVSLGF